MKKFKPKPRQEILPETCITNSPVCTKTMTETDLFFGNKSCLACRLYIQKKKK